MGTPYSYVYLVDRDTGDLVQQSHPWASDQAGNVSDRLVPERTGIAAEAKETGQSIHVSDIRRSANRVVAPMHPDVQSALALPLSARGRVVGVIEIHSTVPDAFRNRPTNLFEQQLAWRLEDAWLLENGWLVRQLRDVLRHLWDDLHLGRSALAEWALHIDNTHVERTPAARGVALRTQLLALIDGLSPEAHDQSRPGRGQRILRLTYADERSADAIAHELHISRRQYFYDLKESLEALADAMVREHQAKLQAQAHR
jgi:putative methionine-R-sulfoxide reductase with GAF domain